ncbi:MAG: VCBS repeat-containing protein [Planctomycetaceae bacterium]|nr:VCBS repeat-containing protein [Planctomycetaceae bacterium]
MLEERILPAVTLLIDYSLDNGFFNAAERRTAIEAAANEIGSRLNDALPYVPAGSYSVTDPKTFTSITRTFDVPANAIRVFVAGSSFGGNIVGTGGWRSNTGLRSFDRNNDFQPYVGYVGFDNDGSTSWNFSDTASGSQTNFRAVARHELLHVLGLGGTASWDVRISGGLFIGAKTLVANGGSYPPVDSSSGHFAQGVNSIMAPVISSITRPTAVDWAALDDIGWDVTAPPAPGVYADVLGQSSNGNWWISSNSGASGLSAPTIAGHWNSAAGWRDVQFGDVDGNGLTDIVGRTAGGAWWVGLNTGGNFENRYFGSWSSLVGWQDVKVGDFDGDGRSDIVGRTAIGAWYVARSVGTSFVTTRWTGWNELAGWQDVRVGDFNGDGRDDVAARTKYGDWWVARSTGSSFASSRWAGWSEAAGWRDVLVADFDGNGRDDIAARTKFGEWFVALSVGAAFSTGRWTNWNEAAGWRDVKIGDFYGDGRPDIIGRTSTGAWYLAANLGSSFNTLPSAFGAWTETLGWRDVQVGQFAGNGKMDVLARTATGTWYVGENSGSAMTFRPFGQWNEGLVWKNVASGRNLLVAATGAAAASSTVVGEDIELSSASGSFAVAKDSSTPDATVPPLNGSAAPPDRSDFSPPTDDDAVMLSSGKRELESPKVRASPQASASLDDVFSDAGLLSALVS